MILKDKVAVVTGGAHGIGQALARRFAADGARWVVVADLDGDAASKVAAEIGGIAIRTDVRSESEIQNMVRQAIEACGPIDLFCSNAGIGVPGGAEAPDEDWQRIWEINVMAHVWAARAALPAMLARGEGYLLHTASAAGLLSQIGSAPYSVTKHAAVAFAEWLSITHGDAGIKVSCLCPQGVRTRMLMGEDLSSKENFLYADSVSPEEVAEAVIQGLADERFLILPHPEVAGYFGRKASDYERWLRGMRRLQVKVKSASATAENLQRGKAGNLPAG